MFTSIFFKEIGQKTTASTKFGIWYECSLSTVRTTMYLYIISWPDKFLVKCRIFLLQKVQDLLKKQSYSLKTTTPEPVEAPEFSLMDTPTSHDTRDNDIETFNPQPTPSDIQCFDIRANSFVDFTPTVDLIPSDDLTPTPYETGYVWFPYLANC